MKSFTTWIKDIAKKAKEYLTKFKEAKSFLEKIEVGVPAFEYFTSIDYDF